MNVRETYRLYLMSLILPPSEVGSDSTALLLFESLDEIPFESYVPMDENRISDAIDIRDRWINGVYERAKEMALQPVTLLEILVELSMYMAFARENLSAPSEPSRWFYEMLSNIGLDEYSSREEILRKGTAVVRRDYDDDGEGSLFPMKHARHDMRKVELWMQLNQYLIERYHA